MPIQCFVFLSTHYHLLCAPQDANHLARFMSYVSGNLAREICRLVGWSGKVWARRYAHVPVLGDEAQVDRLRYLLAQGVKEGLVAHAIDWPGASAVPALLDGSMRLVGTWYDRTAAYQAARAGQAVEPADWIHEKTVLLTPLPALAHLAVEEYNGFVSSLVRQIESDCAHTPADVMGAEAAAAQDPKTIVRQRRRTPIPLVHAASIELWRAFRDAYRAFVAAFQFARAQLKAGIKDAVFPEGSFGPALGFVPFSRK
jgi:putative transposase